ncbi:MAG: hypothetical protein V1918_11100, partial [Planctomycetota bacterium]
MKILYLTDNRSDYRGGYYYVDWMEAVSAGNELVPWGPGFPEPPEAARREAELLVVGHGALDVLVAGGYDFARRTRWRPWGAGVPYWDRAIRNFSGPKAMFTKNDYKYIPGKIVLARNEGIGLIVTHSREAVAEFREGGVRAEWIPFGVNRRRFRCLGRPRDIDIGFRGGLHAAYTGDLRPALVERARRTCADFRLDLVASDAEERFLFGEA